MSKTLPVGIQVYGLRDLLENTPENFKSVMQKVKDLGYDGVELAGLYGLTPEYVKEVLDEVGLIPISAHVAFADMMEEQQPEKLNSVCHNEIEANLDSLFLRYERKQKISSFKLQTASPLKDRVNHVIAQMWQGFILAYLGEDIETDELIQVQKDWHYSLVLLNDKGAFKKHVVKLGERLLGLSPVLSPIIRTAYPDLSFDYANMSHREWNSNTDGKPHKENFFELADIAEEKALALISSIMTERLLTHEQCKDSFTGK